MDKYTVVTWKEEGIWTAHSPVVPGVWGLGKSRRAAVADFQSALRDEVAYQKRIGKLSHRSKRTSVSLTIVEV